MSVLSALSDAIWNPWLLALFLLTGLWYSVRTGFFQFFEARRWLRATAGTLFARRERAALGGLTQFQACLLYTSHGLHLQFDPLKERVGTGHRHIHPAAHHRDAGGV